MSISSTIGKLRLEVRGARHSGGPRFDDWFEDVTLVIYPANVAPEHILLQGNLEIATVLQWLTDCESKIREQIPPVSQRPGETIGQTLARAYDAVSDDLPGDVIDLATEALYQYNSHHNIAFGFPGMATPRLLLGIGHDGAEVCNWINDVDNDAAWSYLFDVDDFYAHLPAPI